MVNLFYKINNTINTVKIAVSKPSNDVAITSYIYQPSHVEHIHRIYGQIVILIFLKYNHRLNNLSKPNVFGMFTKK